MVAPRRVLLGQGAGRATSSPRWADPGRGAQRHRISLGATHGGRDRPSRRGLGRSLQRAPEAGRTPHERRDPNTLPLGDAAAPTRANGAPVYLDYQATTPTDPRVHRGDAALFTEAFGTAFGAPLVRAPRRRSSTARAQVAPLIGAEAREIRLHLGRDRIDNLAIKARAVSGATSAASRNGINRHPGDRA